MNTLIGLLYGAVQAVSEFLPISSSGHLALIPHFLEIDDPGVAFDLAMHVGTALAVIVYFFKDIIFLIKNKYIVNYILATVVSVLFILIFKDIAESYGRSPIVIGVNLIVFGWILYFADKIKIKSKMDFKYSYLLKDSCIIGLSQVLAIFPGVSRSGITITAARALGFTREQGSGFSFLLSLPIIFGGIILKSRELFVTGSAQELSPVMIGFVTSFVLGMIVIHFFFKLLSKLNFLYFALYRTIIGLMVIYFL